MSNFVCEGESGDFWRDAWTVVDQRNDACVEAFVDATTVFVVFLPALTQATRRLCVYQHSLYMVQQKTLTSLQGAVKQWPLYVSVENTL